MDFGRPKTVKVTVYSSRNLKQRKGDGDPLAWAVFGFGKDKCCTSQIRDQSAKWNEESTFTLSESNKHPLKINVKDKDEMLGQIIIPVEDIPSEEHFLKWVSLGPHKKNTNPSGEICLDCWIEEYYDGGDTSSSNLSNPKNLLNKTINRLKGRSPEAVRKLRVEDNRRYSMGSGLMSIKGSVSVEDLSSHNRNKSRRLRDNLLVPNSLFFGNNSDNKTFDLRKTENSNFVNDQVDSAVSLKRLSVGEMTSHLPVIKEQCHSPKIISFVPSSGPSSGGTLIQITGKHLGVSHEDITRLMVAGCNCLSTLEYYASNKIMCKTSLSQGMGPITIQTKSGGVSSSKLMFEFLEEKVDAPAKEHIDQDSGLSSGSDSPESDRDKDAVIDSLRKTIDGLQYNNAELREYIDRLIVYLMDKYPDALESSKMYK